MPKAPKSAAAPRTIKQTNEHDIDKFCIPKENRNINTRVSNASILLTHRWVSYYLVVSIFKKFILQIHGVVNQIAYTFVGVRKTILTQLTHFIVIQINT